MYLLNGATESLCGQVDSSTTNSYRGSKMRTGIKHPMLTSGLLLALSLAFPAASASVVVQSTLLDFDNDASTVGPPLVDAAGNPVQNGDFLIFRIQEASDVPVGNGVDERTRGLFDFRGDSNYSAFSSLLAQPHGKVMSAVLSLVLTPNSVVFGNDTIGLENGPFLSNLRMDQIRPFNPDDEDSYVTNVYTIDLLDFYSQQQLTNFLSGGTEGSLPGLAQDGRIIFQYSDDAFVSGASLRLIADVPEPGTLALLSLGLLAAGFAARSRPR
jgi:PEP-CTERM motif